MSLHPVGLVAASATFLGIWLGHVCVRKVEFVSKALWMPITLACLIGLSFEVGALLSPSQAVSGALGILGMTILWDALELPRQARRVAEGRVPANRKNPRHALLLACGRATMVDWLDRAPCGHPLGPEELAASASACPEVNPTIRSRVG